MLRTALTLIAGLAIGVGFGVWIAGSRAPVAAEPVATIAPAAPDEPRAASGVAAPSTERTPVAKQEHVTPSPERALAGPEQGLISDALRAFVAAGILEGWASERREAMPEELQVDGMERFEQLVLESPRTIGAAIGVEVTKREAALEDARTGGAFALLEALAKGGGPVLELGTNAKAMDALFPRDVTGPTVRAETMLSRLGEALVDGATLSFPSGVFGVGDLPSEKTPFPRDVTVSGAGMKVTLLVLRTDWGARGTIRRLHVKDCTIFTDNNSLFDQRSGSVTLLLERVRIIGFDRGSGGSSAMDFNPGAVLLARDCRFEGGYGRTPGGRLFDVRTDALVARFERCLIARINISPRLIRSGATIVFDACRLEDLLDHPSRDPADHPGIVYASGTTSSFHDPKAGNIPRLDLNDLFPGWKERIVR